MKEDNSYMIKERVFVSWNGKRWPAEIVGRLNGFATVAILDNGPCFEFSWPTVRRALLENRVLFA